MSHALKMIAAQKEYQSQPPAPPGLQPLPAAPPHQSQHSPCLPPSQSFPPSPHCGNPVPIGGWRQKNSRGKARAMAKNGLATRSRASTVACPATTPISAGICRWTDISALRDGSRRLGSRITMVLGLSTRRRWLRRKNTRQRLSEKGTSG